MAATSPLQLYPLSHPQKRIWYNEIIHLNTAFANLPFTVRYPSEIRFDLLSEAINHVIRIHDGLRLRLVKAEENDLVEIRQYVSDFRELSFPAFDFSGTDGSAKLAEWIALDAKTPFSLIDSDLFSFALMRFSEKEWGYYFKIHHIIGDGWTVNLVTRSIDRAYSDLLEGKSLPEIPAPSYLAYLEDEKEYLSSDSFSRDRDFWLGNLLPLPEEVVLSFGKNKTGNIRSATKVFAFPGPLLEKMQEFGKTHKSSVFKLVLAALAVYIRRIAGIDDVAIASVNHGRINPDHRDMAGMFVNTFILRTRVNSEMTFSELADQAGSQVNEIIRNHSRYPVDLLIRDLRDRAGTDPTYLLNTMLVGHPSPDAKEPVTEYVFPGYEVSPLVMHLNASGKEAEGILELQFDYHTELFREEDLERIFLTLQAILDDGLSGPEKKIRDIGLVPENIKNRILHDFNDTAVGFPDPVFIKELFEKQVLRTPDKPAVVYREKKLTYRELNSRANRLARTLRDLGAGPDAIVGILADRSLEMIVGVMAVIKSGSAYVPIDAGYPAERIEYLLENSNSIALLSKKELSSNIRYAGKIIDLADETSYSGEDTDLQTVNKPSDLVYVIYTSGSTGKPKGVMIGHRALTNFVLWHKDLNHMNEQDNVSKFASFGFDVTVIEIYPTLISGATLHIIPDEIRLSPMQVNEYFEKNRITAAFFPTQFGEQFIENIENSSLRWLEVAGEKMRSFRKRPYQVLNGYGPTEYTVYTTSFLVDRFYENIPIGIPLWNTRIYILDPFNNLLPVGIPGELCVAGTGIARGYLGRPDLTAEKFIEDPFCHGEKMYRTGDLCRWLPDGNIEYMGRMDFQVKIRGFRVELGEIEQAMKSVADVRDAVVVDRTDENGRKYLCGFFVSEQDIDPAVIREKLGIDLPEYMIPPFISRIDKIPLTPNGKIDRKALPVPERTEEKGKSFILPETGTEKILSEIWKTILGTEKISADDSFFELGGHSLKAALLQARIQKDFRIQLSLQTIFHNARLRDLARLIDRATEQECLRITRIPSGKHYPVSPAQNRLFIVGQMENIGITYNIPVVMRIEGNLDPDRLSKAIGKMTERHEILRTSFAVSNGEPVQVVHPKVRMKRIFLETDEAGIDKAIRDFIRPFDLEKPPLFRAGLIRISENRHLFIFDVHHIIFDGWSAGVFMDELWDLYEGKKLLPRKLQYRDYAAWQLKVLQGEVIRKQEKYWLDIFRTTIPVLNMETVYPRGSSISFGGARLHITIGEAVVSRLREIAREQDATLFMLLLSAYSILLSKYSGQDDIVIGIPSSGRTIPEVERMIGMFVNSLPIRTLPDGNKRFNDFLKEIRELVLGASDNQDYPLESLVEKLGMKRDSSRNPLFDVMFAFRQQPREKTCEDLVINPWEFDFNITKFDLTIEAIEKEKEIRLEIEYRTGLFDEKYIRTLGAHFLNLLGEIASNPATEIREISVLTPEEKKFLLTDYNNTSRDYPCDRTVYELFEERVLAGPDRVAVIHDDRSETYAGLNAKANRFASLLRQKGVVPDTVVAVMMEQSIEFIIAVLGIIKAGGAYLPIDPEYPEERVSFILENSSAAILVTSGTGRNEAPAFTGERILLGKDFPFEGDGGNPEKMNQPDDLVYIIYTSGSTGKPKGVMITHRGLVNYITWAEKVYLEGEKLDFPLYSSVAFDLTVTSIFTPLVSGNRIHVYSGGDKTTLVERLVKDNKTGIVKLTPSHLSVIENLDCSASVIRKFIVGGEELRSQAALRTCAKFPHGIRVFNEYGPTETVVGCMIHRFDPEKDIRPSVPIGVPGDNVRIYLLDKYLKPVPRGVVGELYISGDGVALGYRNRPEITAERFLDDPFSPGKKMYRSGDLAKFLDNGEIEFLGRVDFQVKIHGFRIELGEIESRLSAHPLIREAVVLPQSDDDGTPYLCGYYCAEKPVAVPELKSFLSEDLPGYMIPSFFFHMEKIPVTPNGKVDRNRLPKKGDTVYTGIGFAEPRNETERIIRNAFAGILKLDRIGINDNFFDLGGNSLKAVSLVAELRKDFETGMNDVFRYQTIAQLAKNIRPSGDQVIRRLRKLQDTVPGETGPSGLPGVKKAMRQYRAKMKEEKDIVITEKRTYDHILLTGATGFLGAYLLRDLLQTTKAKITLPIRAGSGEQAEKKLEEKISYYFGKQLLHENRGRISVLRSDLSEDALGLGKKEYDKLSGTVDCIIHSAALVKHYGPYEDFHSSNVRSVENLIRFAMAGKPKVFHHISTLSVGMGNVPGRKVNLFSEYDTDIGQQSEMYYLRTKLEAEKRLADARKEGLCANVYRIGNITFDSKTGRCQENIGDNAFFHVVRSFVNLGCVPDRMDEAEFSFVDRVSRAILSLYDRPSLFNETFHIRNSGTVRLSEVLTSPALGLRIRKVAFRDFIGLMIGESGTEGFREHIEAILLHFGWLERSGEGDEGTLFMPVSGRTERILRKTGFRWRPLHPERMESMIVASLKERAGILKQVPLFSPLPEEELLRLAKAAVREHYRDDTGIIWEGEPGNRFYVIEKGNVEMSCHAVSGWVGTVGVLGKGEFFAAAQIYRPEASPFTATAILGDVMVYSFTLEDIRRMIEEHPRLGISFVKFLASRVDQLARLFVNIR